MRCVFGSESSFTPAEGGNGGLDTAKTGGGLQESEDALSLLDIFLLGRSSTLREGASSSDWLL
jgi:hypothetical protein